MATTPTGIQQQLEKERREWRNSRAFTLLNSCFKLHGVPSDSMEEISKVVRDDVRIIYAYVDEIEKQGGTAE